MNLELIKKCADLYLNKYGTLTAIQKEFGVNKDKIKEYLISLGYTIRKGIKIDTVINLKKAQDKYIYMFEKDLKPSMTTICKEFHIDRRTLSTKLKELDIPVINYHNETKFNEHIFDVIDTEEKAYWLGFIFADGYISTKDYHFEISLKASDIEHLNKFNIFMKHRDKIVKISDAKCNDKICKRCRWYVVNKHLWNTLNELGCTPRKSLTLKFPNIDKLLVKHFIRGYIDGDGCLSYCDKNHKHCILSILGTENFLTGIKENLPCKYDYKIQHHNNIYILTIHGINAFNIIKYLYTDSKIYLDRKYNKFMEFCRLYE